MLGRHIFNNAVAVISASLGLACAVGVAQAQAGLSLPLTLGADGSVNSVAYSCADGTDLLVQYVNAGSNTLALIPLKGETRIFVGVISGSGARYVSGASEWWTKGDEARMGDEMSDAKPITCTAAAKK
ncbi:MliC family protein [Roseovarius sp. S4756]|uniref:MliC family protein n=1 Tax=Roseovarius maritimus TaxID=3342637 RepID=UPI003726AA5E